MKHFKFSRRAGMALAALCLGLLPCAGGLITGSPSLPTAAAENAAPIDAKEFLARLKAAAKKAKLKVPENIVQLLKKSPDVKFEVAAQAVAVTFDLVATETDPPLYCMEALMGSGLTEGVKSSIGDALTVAEADTLIANTLEFYREQCSEDAPFSLFSYSGMMKNATHASGGLPLQAPRAIAEEEDGLPAPEPVGPQPYFSDTESYRHETENIFRQTATSPLSTFSIDTDTASYSNLRRFITDGSPIPAAAIRTEELINYFSYDYPQPKGDAPFSIVTEIAQCPWNEEHRLALIALRGAEMTEQQPSNITFLVDVSGSMYSPEKLPLVKRSLNILLDRLAPDDRISLVTYASGVEVILDGEPAAKREKIKKAFNSLNAEGGTSGAEGLNLAYKTAAKHMVKGNNRIILCTDGDFNIGPSSDAEMLELIEKKRRTGIFISVLGFGMGNYKDSKMQVIADAGNGNHAYIDNIREAKKVLVDDMTKTIYTIAKDVKLQIEFNPAVVAEYRLIGYEKRRLENEDFDNDAKDAGDLGAGSTVTALYELVMNDGSEPASDLRYSELKLKDSDEPFFVRLRYKTPDGDESRLIEQTVNAASRPMSENFRWASAVAELGLFLTDSPYKGTANLDSIITRAKSAYGNDPYGLRHEFVQLTDLLKYTETLKNVNKSNK